MTVDRKTPTTLTHPDGIDDEDYADAVAEEIADLHRRAPVFLTILDGGTENAILTQSVPPLQIGERANRFYLVPEASNTDELTITVDNAVTFDVVDVDGNDLVGSELIVGRLQEFIYDGTNLRLITPLSTVPMSTGVPGLVVSDHKTLNTGPGSIQTGAWRTRDLNTVERNVISGASLGSNRITLPAGTYAVEWTTLQANTSRSRIQNITDGETLAESISNGRTGWDVFTLGSSKMIELQLRSSFGTTLSPGVSNLGTDEIFSIVKIWQVS